MSGVITTNTRVKIKEAPAPYSIELENLLTEMKQNLANVKVIEETFGDFRSTAGVGIDQGAFSALSSLEFKIVK